MNKLTRNKKYILSKTKSKGQFSLEFMLIMLAFFSALLILIPTINTIKEQFLYSNDILTIKEAIKTIENKKNTFGFLAEGTTKSIEIIPLTKIMVEKKNKQILFSVGEKNIILDMLCKQENSKKEFSKRFFIKLEKKNNCLFLTTKAT